MHWSEADFRPSDRKLRQFAALALLVFGTLAAWQLFGRGRPIAAALLAATALGLGPLGLVWPRALRPVFVGCMILTLPLGWLVSHAVLGLVYFGLITPLALVFRLTGRDVLHLRRPRLESYWQSKTQPADVRRYFRQF